MAKPELVFIPFPGLSHLVSTVEFAKILLRRRQDTLLVTVLTMKLVGEHLVDGYLHNLSSDPDTPTGIRFIPLPNQEQAVTSPFEYIKGLKGYVKEVVSDLISKQSSPPAGGVGIVVDLFCTNFVEVGRELNIPVYVFFTSGACALGLITHLLDQDLDLKQYKDSEIELSVPCFSNPVPATVIPRVLVEGGAFGDFVAESYRGIKKADGVLINTFKELEDYTIGSMASDPEMPKVYPVGPILNLKSDQGRDDGGVKKWLDEQPENSVVFLCFGSMGSFEVEQVGYIASALENSGIRFLWSLRKPPKRGGGLHFNSDYETFDEVLPEGFLSRTKGIGRVIGWAPQTAVLAHPAVGGFVSHCGWNSTLESVWFGVPVATFPLAAEQQVNAFLLVRELKMAEAIRIDYNVGATGGNPSDIVQAEDIEGAIRRLMGGGAAREKVKEMQRKSRSALEEGGSSYSALDQFINDVVTNL